MSYLVDGKTATWEVVIGLEVHAQVTSQSKLFSGASAAFGGAPNSHVDLLDAGLPGMLPVVNGFCVEQAVKTGLGLNAQINRRSVFARKNYFYADMPLGYQISQYEAPIVGEGVITIDLEDGTSRQIGIERLHLEADAGKSLHDQHPSKSYVDLNRAGVALMEIVSKPDLRSPEEAGAYMRKLRAILRTLGTCDGNMNEGSLRCDANVSVRPVGETVLRTRCEIKNLNSVRFVMQAIDSEARRQVACYDAGEAVDQETRLFDTARNETRAMRSKEHAHDYRYFPDPDLLPLELDEDFIARLRADLPELPDQRKARLVATHGLSEADASALVADTETAAYFEAVAHGRDGKLAANWVLNVLFGMLAKQGLEISRSPVSAEGLGELLDLLSDDTISGRIAKEVFDEMIDSGETARTIVERKGLRQITDSGELAAIVDQVVASGGKQVEQFRSGNEKVLGWFVGQVMKATGGKANPALVNQLLREKLKS